MDLSKPLQTQLYDHLKEQILAGEFDTGVFYSETKLAKELSVSRTPLRNALRALEQDGYLIISPSRGFQLRKLNQEGLRSNIEIRCALEGYCAYCAAEQPDTAKTQELIQKLEYLLNKAEIFIGDPAKLSDFMKYDHAFHVCIVSFTGIQGFQSDFQKIYYWIRQTSERELQVEGRVQETFDEHQRILEYIRNGDKVAAYQEMIRHLKKPLSIVEL